MYAAIHTNMKMTKYTVYVHMKLATHDHFRYEHEAKICIFFNIKKLGVL